VENTSSPLFSEGIVEKETAAKAAEESSAPAGQTTKKKSRPPRDRRAEVLTKLAAAWSDGSLEKGFHDALTVGVRDGFSEYTRLVVEGDEELAESLEFVGALIAHGFVGQATHDLTKLNLGLRVGGRTFPVEIKAMADKKNDETSKVITLKDIKTGDLVEVTDENIHLFKDGWLPDVRRPRRLAVTLTLGAGVGALGTLGVQGIMSWRKGRKAQQTSMPSAEDIELRVLEGQR